MVLTQLKRPTKWESVPKSFHTTMVLTQRFKLEGEEACPSRFPYHYGSYATLWNGYVESFFNCFHTTMVLTQRSRWRDSSLWQDVSIPLWFLRNSGVLNELRISKVSFPYHYGSYATGFNSIPQRHTTGFPYHYGSHATNWKVFKTELSVRFHTTMVLTQLHNRRWIMDESNSFHTTMVLTQPSMAWNIWNARTQFPYHYGSHAT